jgi:hypothetical protein
MIHIAFWGWKGVETLIQPVFAQWDGANHQQWMDGCCMIWVSEGHFYSFPLPLSLPLSFLLFSLKGCSSCPTCVKSFNPCRTGNATCGTLRDSQSSASPVTSCTRQLPRKRFGFMWFLYCWWWTSSKKKELSPPPLRPTRLMSQGQFDCQRQKESPLI